MSWGIEPVNRSVSRDICLTPSIRKHGDSQEIAETVVKDEAFCRKQGKTLPNWPVSKLLCLLCLFSGGAVAFFLSGYSYRLSEECTSPRLHIQTILDLKVTQKCWMRCCILWEWNIHLHQPLSSCYRCSEVKERYSVTSCFTGMGGGGGQVAHKLMIVLLLLVVCTQNRFSTNHTPWIAAIFSVDWTLMKL